MYNGTADKYYPLVRDSIEDEYEELSPCDDCLAKDELNTFGQEDYEEEDTMQNSLCDDLNESADKILEALLFLGDGTSSKDVMIALLELEAVIANIKIYLLESD